MRKFRTQFDRVLKVSKVGERVEDTFQAVVSENGSIDLEVNGKVDRYAYIQSFKDETDLSQIIKRFTRGDMSGLRDGGMYGDFTEFPKTYAEAQQKMINATNMFMELPVEKRALYNHDPNQFIADIGSEKWMDVLGIKPVETVEKPVENIEKGGDVNE